MSRLFRAPSTLTWWFFASMVTVSCSNLSSTPGPGTQPAPIGDEGAGICAGSSFRSVANPEVMVSGSANCHVDFSEPTGVPTTEAPAGLPPVVVSAPFKFNHCDETSDVTSFITSRTDDLPLLSLFLHPEDGAREIPATDPFFVYASISSVQTRTPTYFGVIHSQMTRLTAPDTELMDRFCVHTVQENVSAVRALDVPVTLTGDVTPYVYRKIKRLAFAASGADITQGARACHELARAHFAGSAGWSMIGGIKPVIVSEAEGGLLRTLRLANKDVPEPTSNVDVASFGDAGPGALNLSAYLNFIGLRAPAALSLAARLKFVFAGSGRLGKARQEPPFYQSSLLSCAGLNHPGDVALGGIRCIEDEFDWWQDSSSVRDVSYSPATERYTMGYGEKMGVLCGDF